MPENAPSSTLAVRSRRFKGAERRRHTAKAALAAALLSVACTAKDSKDGLTPDPSAPAESVSVGTPSTSAPAGAEPSVTASGDATVPTVTGSSTSQPAPSDGPTGLGGAAGAPSAMGGAPPMSTGAAGAMNPEAEAGSGGNGANEGSDAGTTGLAADAGMPDGGSNGGDVSASDGCGKEPTLTNSPSPNQLQYNELTSGGATRRYVVRLPEDYDNTKPHRLILGFHGASNNAGHVAGPPAFFGLYDLAGGSTIFVAPEAVDGLWSDSADVVFVDDILQQVEAELCIDTSRRVLQGFSQGAAMVRVLACERPGVFSAAIGHSAGGLPLPASCEPIPYFGSLGLQESGGGGQLGQTELFANAAGCTVETLPSAPAGGHACSDYSGCSAEHPVRWCSFDAGHTPLPSDMGQNSSWMPEEVWAFLSQF